MGEIWYVHQEPCQNADLAASLAGGCLGEFWRKTYLTLLCRASRARIVQPSTNRRFSPVHQISRMKCATRKYGRGGMPCEEDHKEIALSFPLVE